MLWSVDAKAAVRMLVSMHRAKLVQVLRSAVAPTQVMSAVTGQRRRFAEKTCGYLFSRSALSLADSSIPKHSPRCGECFKHNLSTQILHRSREKVPTKCAQVRMSEVIKSVRGVFHPGVQHAPVERKDPGVTSSIFYCTSCSPRS